MHTLRISTRLLLLPLLCLAGCASTSGVSSKMQTVASVGDKRYPVVTGEPGSSVVADVAPTEPSVRSKGRISGRVVDESGEPLSNVRVRLAVGNTPGGQLIRATTDRTGAFTLNGVRAGSAHTVIAEWEDGEEYLTGRSVVDAPDTNVRITLAPYSNQAQTASAGTRSGRISPISDRAALSDQEEEGDVEAEADLDAEASEEPPRVSSRKSRVNEEDLPPAREAESFAPPVTSKTPAGPRQGVAPSGRAGWRRVGAEGDAPKASKPGDSASAALQDPEAREAGAIASNVTEDDEGPNPLPPALEPGEAPRAQDREPLPRGRKPKRSTQSVEDEDPLPPAREPGEISASPKPRRSKPKLIEPEPEPVSEDSDPLPPAREPESEGDVSSAEPNPFPAAADEPGPSAISPVPTELAGLPPAVESGPVKEEPPMPVAAPVAASAPTQEPSAPSADLVALSETVPPFLSDLPTPVEAGAQAAAATAPATNPTASLPPVAEGTAMTATPSPTPTVAQPEIDQNSVFETPSFEPAPAAVATAAPMIEASDQSVFETGLGEPAPASNPAPAASPDTRKRPTWKELAALASKPSPTPTPVPKVRETEASALPPAQPAVHNFLMERPPTLKTVAQSAPPQPKADVGGAFCDYDAKHRKINDFRLPDLEGRPVRFQELDADLVLLDFWGTWCQPCLRSVPHLVDLQKRMEGRKLKVVGIACEQSPLPERAKTVAQEVSRLGINYPVLLSGMDGPCPLQEALKVQAYPTLILVDRQGRIVWRDQGATPVTMARLDSFLGSAAKGKDVRRY